MSLLDSWYRDGRASRVTGPMHFLPNFGPWIAGPAIWCRQIYIPVPYSRRVVDVL
jgi:hypothetical protein